MSDRIAVDGCMVVNRVELEAAVDAARIGADTIGYRQGVVGGLIASAVLVAVWGGPFAFSVTGSAVGLLIGAAVLVPLWRMWDASGAKFTLGWWSAADFAAHLKDQWAREASDGHGG